MSRVNGETLMISETMKTDANKCTGHDLLSIDIVASMQPHRKVISCTWVGGIVVCPEDEHVNPGVSRAKNGILKNGTVYK